MPLRSLFTRLAFGLFVILLVIGLLYSVLNSFATRKYMEELNVDLNRMLASDLVADRNLVAEGEIDEDALKETFRNYMLVNPSIEIYLLDLDGNLLSYSAEQSQVMRNAVSLDPIRGFLDGSERYPLGDDPRSHDKRKAFSVTEVPSAENPEGYLYVVLRGERFDDIEAMAFEGLLARASAWAMGLSLALGLGAGLIIFYWLTKRLRRVSRQIEQLNSSEFTQWDLTGDLGRQEDEIGQIELTLGKMAERIKEQLSALTQQDSERRHLVAQVSHDLRTPLASMLGYLESMRLKRSSLTEDERDRFVEIVYRQGQRLNHMVESLFQLSALEAREMKAQLEPFHPLELLYDVRQKHLERARGQGLDLSIEPDEEVGFLLGDVSLFERVLDNLIDNALVHARANSDITLSIRCDQGEGVVSVHNVGDPIDDADMPHLFEPFYRTKALSADSRHAGLGLAISARIVRSMGGGIAARNFANGVEFRACLPIAE